MASLKALRERYDQDGMLWHSLVMMLFQHMGSAANLLFHVVMGRVLSAIEYGVLASMLGVILIFATPMLALQNTLAHFSARLGKEGHAGAIPSLIWFWYKKLMGPAVLIAVTAVLLSGTLAHFFHLDSRWPIILSGLTLSASLLMFIIPGSLQGLQRFFLFCMNINTWGFIRLVLGFLLVSFVGPTASYGLAAQVVGVFMMFVVGYYSLRYVLRDEPPSDEVMTGVEQYFWKSVITWLCYGFLMNVDIVLVKHFFTPEQAGVFARSATIGRTAVFLCQPVATALFPKVVSGGDSSRAEMGTLMKALSLSALMMGGVALGVTLLPKLPLLILFKDTAPTAEQIAVTRMLIWAMAPAGLTLVLLNFEMAQHRFAMLWPLSICAIAYVVGVAVWHETFTQVIIVMACVGLTSAVSLIALLPWKGKRATGA